MNRAHLLGEQRTVNPTWLNNPFNRASGCCKSNARPGLYVGRKLDKWRDANPRTDDQITGDRATRTWLDAKVSVDDEISLGDRLGVRGNHLTRIR